MKTVSENTDIKVLLKIIEEQQATILRLEQRVAQLEHLLYGTKAEKSKKKHLSLHRQKTPM